DGWTPQRQYRGRDDRSARRVRALQAARADALSGRLAALGADSAAPQRGSAGFARATVLTRSGLHRRQELARCVLARTSRRAARAPAAARGRGLRPPVAARARARTPRQVLRARAVAPR